jgi:hypothetical protein
MDGFRRLLQTQNMTRSFQFFYFSFQDEISEEKERGKGSGVLSAGKERRRDIMPLLFLFLHIAFPSLSF